MLRRLTEEDKIKACSILKAMDGTPIQNPGESILYTPPHDEFGSSMRAQWPTTQIIEQWNLWE